MKKLLVAIVAVMLGLSSVAAYAACCNSEKKGCDAKVEKKEGCPKAEKKEGCPKAEKKEGCPKADPNSK